MRQKPLAEYNDCCIHHALIHECLAAVRQHECCPRQCACAMMTPREYRKITGYPAHLFRKDAPDA